MVHPLLMSDPDSVSTPNPLVTKKWTWFSVGMRSLRHTRAPRLYLTIFQCHKKITCSYSGHWPNRQQDNFAPSKCLKRKRNIVCYTLRYKCEFIIRYQQSHTFFFLRSNAPVHVWCRGRPRLAFAWAGLYSFALVATTTVEMHPPITAQLICTGLPTICWCLLLLARACIPEYIDVAC